MLWIEHKYISLLSGRLERFQRINSNVYRFRCPICGDSQKDRHKTRGHLLEKSGKIRFYCHNCSASMQFKYFMKEIDPTLYLEYIKEQIKESGNQKDVETFAKKMKPPVFVKTTALSKLKKVSQLDPDHPVKKYIDSRQIPSNLHYKLFYAPKFGAWVNSMIPNKMKIGEKDEPRLIIPFLDQEKNLFGFQGRSFRKDGVRYITIMLDESKPKVFGLDTIDESKDIYLLEGPIDSMFLPNAMAAAGGDLSAQIEQTGLLKEKIVVVFDNEPRHSDTIKRMQKAIDAGYRVVIWPSDIQYKDVNDMILSGMKSEYIKDVLDECNYSGPTAKLHFALWRKDR
jgi:transcription elongation factor Elf1